MHKERYVLCTLMGERHSLEHLTSLEQMVLSKYKTKIWALISIFFSKTPLKIGHF